MTSANFRALALDLPDATEASHMDHPDFRVRGKIFATLGYPKAGWGMVRLPAAYQARLLRERPAVFIAAPGAWGRQGATLIKLGRAPKALVQAALREAWTARKQ